MKSVIEYGPPCFQDGSPRSITIYENNDGSWQMFFATSYVQGMREGVNDGVTEGVLSVFEEYRSKLKGDDKKLFKHYFDTL